MLNKQALPRFHELDSLRGLAACTVVLCHFRAGVGDQASLWILQSPLKFLVAGHDAVILFFVLSGFVLIQPWTSKSPLGYSTFLIRRICRIYLPYLAALMLAVAMNAHYHGLVIDDEWINLTWNQKPSMHLIIQHLVLLGDYQWDAFNGAFWSLVYEMRISIIFPFLAVAVLYFRNSWLLVLAISTSLLSAHYYRIFSLLHLIPQTLPFIDTLHYMSFFILGAVLARNREAIQVRYKTLPRFLVWALVVLAIAFYYHPVSVPMLAARILPERKMIDWSAAFGSLILVSMALGSGSFKRLLNHSAINYLGRISYSLYLVHGTVLFTMIYLYQDHLKLAVLPVYLLAVLGLASSFYYVIERPSMLLGRRLGKLLDRQLQLGDFGFFVSPCSQDV